MLFRWKDTSANDMQIVQVVQPLPQHAIINLSHSRNSSGFLRNRIHLPAKARPRRRMRTTLRLRKIKLSARIILAVYPSRREGCSPARKTDDRNLIHVCPRIALERKREIEASGTKPVRRLRDSCFEAGVSLCVASKAGISSLFFSHPPLFSSPSRAPSPSPCV